MELVIPVRKGGLGNQMFQVAAALIYGTEQGKQVVIPKEMSHIHKVHPHNYEDSIFSEFPCIAFSLDQIALQKLCENGFTVYPGEPGFEKWSCDPVEGNLILHGYFQYYPPIEKHSQFIVSTFLKGLLSYKETPQNCVAIHVRRGDYLKFTDVFAILGETYYRKAMEEIEKRVGPKKYKIFSDDLEWCKQQEVFRRPTCEFVEEQDEIKTLCTMIACEGGFICANSSFSWWGAFLGAHQKGAPCISPSEWMKGFTGDLLPKEWIVVKC